jgi:hypothetical protein
MTRSRKVLFRTDYGRIAGSGNLKGGLSNSS